MANKDETESTGVPAGAQTVKTVRPIGEVLDAEGLQMATLFAPIIAYLNAATSLPDDDPEKTGRLLGSHAYVAAIAEMISEGVPERFRGNVALTAAKYRSRMESTSTPPGKCDCPVCRLGAAIVAGGGGGKTDATAQIASMVTQLLQKVTGRDVGEVQVFTMDELGVVKTPDPSEIN